MVMKHYSSITELHRENGFVPPEHPLISFARCNNTCPLGDREFTTDMYMIGFKKLKAGVIKYGRTKYDHENGSMSFMKPRQIIEFNNLEFEEDGFLIFIHEDYLAGHPLLAEIRSYGFFEYESNEALHLSPKEEEIIWDLYNKTIAEYDNNPDEYSREIMLSYIGSILKYAQRFYKRQFIDRTGLSGNTVTRFDHVLKDYFESGSLAQKGLPTVQSLASQLNVSARYLSDMLKQETGKTALELIHIHMMTEAKNRLRSADVSIAELAYQLGFENPPYFTRLFKKEVGITPTEFKRTLLN